MTTPTTYGASLPIYSDYVNINGQAYDASPIASVSVTLYCPGYPPPHKPPTAPIHGRSGSSSNPPQCRLAWGTTGKSSATRSPSPMSPGNASTYYYHQQDIYNLLSPTQLFPTVQELGQLDQGGTSPSSPTGIAFAALSPMRLSMPPRAGEI